MDDQARALTTSCSAKAPTSRPAKALKAMQGSALAVAGLAAAQLPAQAMVRGPVDRWGRKKTGFEGGMEVMRNANDNRADEVLWWEDCRRCSRWLTARMWGLFRFGCTSC